MVGLPRITLITPSYNQGAYIEETILSVIDQGYPDLEYLVIDGGSTDQTPDILQRYHKHLDWVSEGDRGQSHAINKGMQRATGDIVAYLNSDDLFVHEALLKVGRFFQDHPQAYWLTGKCRTIDPSANEIRRSSTIYKNFWLNTRSYTALSVLNYISQPATFWRREAIEQVCYFDERWYYAMDYDYWLRLGKHYRLWFLNEYLAGFRVHPASKGRSSTQAQFAEELQVARQYITSRTVLALHDIHSSLSVAIYHYLFGTRFTGEQTPVKKT